MELKHYIGAERGRASALSKALGLPPPTISHWAHGVRPVPVEHCAAIERATEGAVTRKDLRPDDWHRIWPELAKEGANV